MNCLKNILCLIILLHAIATLGQEVDSLKALLQHTHGRERIEILRKLSVAVSQSQPESSVRYALEGYVKAKEIGDSLVVLKVGVRLCTSLRNAGKIDSSLTVSNALLNIATHLKDTANLVDIFNGFGLAYTYNAQYDTALMFYVQALPLAEAIKDTISMSITLNNIGLAYYKIMDYKRALDYFKKCVALKEKTNDNVDILTSLINISLCYAYMGEVVEATKHINKVSALCAGQCSPNTFTQVDYSLGVIAFKDHRFEEAEKHFNSSYQYAKEVGFLRFQLDNIGYLLQIYIRQKDLEKAVNYLNEAERLIQTGDQYNLEVIKLYAQFAKVYQLTKNYPQAAKYQQKYIELRDSLYNEELTANLMKLEAELQKRENDEKIADQNELLVLKEQIITYQDHVNLAMGLVVLVLLILAAILLRSIMERKKIKTLLEKKVQERKSVLESERSRLQQSVIIKKEAHENIVMTVANAITDIKDICGAARGTEASDHDYFLRANSVAESLQYKLGSIQEKRHGLENNPEQKQ